MDYKGVIIEESLGDKSVLGKVKVAETKIEPTTPKHKTPRLQQWTLDTVEVPEKNAEEIAQKISKSFDPEYPNNWYADYKNDTHHFIIFSDKVFKVNLQNPVLYKDAKEYGISMGIPEYQVDFELADKV